MIKRVLIMVSLLTLTYIASADVAFNADFTGTTVGQAWKAKLDSGTSVGEWILTQRGTSRVVSNSTDGLLFRVSGTNYNYTAQLAKTANISDSVILSFDFRSKTTESTDSKANFITLYDTGSNEVLKVGFRVNTQDYIEYYNGSGSLVSVSNGVNLLDIWNDNNDQSNNGPDALDTMQLKLGTTGYGIYLNDVLIVDNIAYMNSGSPISSIQFTTGGTSVGTGAYYDNISLTTVIPEPSTVGLFLITSVSFIIRRAILTI